MGLELELLSGSGNWSLPSTVGQSELWRIGISAIPDGQITCPLVFVGFGLLQGLVTTLLIRQVTKTLTQSTMCDVCAHRDDIAEEVFRVMNDCLNGALSIEDTITTIRGAKARPIRKQGQQMILGYQAELSWFASLTLLLVLDSSQFGMDCHSNYRMCITFCSLIGKAAPLNQLS